MGAQVISKDKMAQNIWTSDLVHVQVVRADLMRSLVEKTPPTDPIFTHSVVAHILQQWVKFIHFVNIVHDHQHVNDWLGADPWNGSAAEMMDGNHLLAKNLAKCLCFASNFAGQSAQ